jgi:hypothetical protein
VPSRQGQFKPGQSGNPGGKPKGYAEMREAARAYTDEALETLVRNLKSKTLGVQAAVAILNRGWGMPSQPHTGEGGEGPIQYLVQWLKVREIEALPTTTTLLPSEPSDKSQS